MVQIFCFNFFRKLCKISYLLSLIFSNYDKNSWLHNIGIYQNRRKTAVCSYTKVAKSHYASRDLCPEKKRNVTVQLSGLFCLWLLTKRPLLISALSYKVQDFKTKEKCVIVVVDRCEYLLSDDLSI